MVVLGMNKTSRRSKKKEGGGVSGERGKGVEWRELFQKDE